MAINGNRIYISIGSNTTPIAGTKSNEIMVGCDTIEISSPDDGVWRRFIAGRKEWSITVNFLLIQDTNALSLLSPGNTYTLHFRSSSTSYMSGLAIMTQCKITATRGNLIQGSFSYKGKGALSSDI